MITSTSNQVYQNLVRGLRCYCYNNDSIQKLSKPTLNNKYKENPIIWNTKRKTNLQPVCLQPFVNISQPILLRRNIFTDQFLDIDRFKEHCNQKRLKLGDTAQLWKRVQESFNKTGIQNIFYEDVENLMFTTLDESHLQIATKIILAFMEDDYRLLPKEKERLLSMLIAQCKILHSKDLAHQIWQNKHTQMYKRKNMFQRYYMLLYENEDYSRIVEDFEERCASISFESTSELSLVRTIVMASLCKIGTEDALSKMTKLMDGSVIRNDDLTQSNDKNIRSGCIYAWLAFKLKKYGMAHDILTRSYGQSRIQFSVLALNMKLSILTETGRLNEALILLRAALASISRIEPGTESGAKRLIFQGKINLNYETVKTLSEAVKNEENSELTKDLVAICQVLDTKGNLIEVSLEEMVLGPISTRNRPTVEQRRNKKGSEVTTTMRRE